MTILPPGFDPANVRLQDVMGILNNLIKNGAWIAGGVAVVFIIIGGIEYLTAYGNEEKANRGKTTVMWAIIGVVVIILARLIVALVTNLLI